MSTKPKPSSGPLGISDRIKARDLRRDDLLARIGIRTPGPRFRFTLGSGVSPLAGDPHKPGILNSNIRTCFTPRESRVQLPSAQSHNSFEGISGVFLVINGVSIRERRALRKGTRERGTWGVASALQPDYA